MHNFGKLTSRKVTFMVGGSDGEPLINDNGTPVLNPDGTQFMIGVAPSIPMEVLAVFNSDDVERHDLYKQFPTYAWYIAVDDDGDIVSMESDPEHSQIAGYSIWGVEADVLDGYTNGPGGSIYGAKFANGIVTPKPKTLPDISDRQFFQQLALMGKITNAEALAAVRTGAIPAAMQEFIDTLPTAQQFDAEMVLSGAKTFQRNHPLVTAFAGALGFTNDDTDALWVAAAKL